MHQKTRSNKLINRLLIVLLIFVWMDLHAKAQNMNPEPTIQIYNLQKQLGSYRHIQFSPKNIELDVVIFNDGYHAKLYQQEAVNPSTAQSIREVSQETHSAVVINGGFYTSNFQPAGLFIENGKILKKVSHDPLLTSCIQINKSGKIFLEKKINSCLHATYAMQTGPLLIEQGDVSQGFSVLQKNLINLKSYFEPHRRTILAQSGNKKLLIIVTSPITLFEAANILKNSSRILEVGNIVMALNLDGGPSTGMHVRFKGAHFYSAEKNPVKTFLLFK